MDLDGLFDAIATAFELAAAALVIAAAVVAAWNGIVAFRGPAPEHGERAYLSARRTLGRGLLLALEIFVAADLIRTLTVDLTVESVAGLGLLVLVRTLLSFSISVEIEGRLPWRAANGSKSASGSR